MGEEGLGVFFKKTLSSLQGGSFTAPKRIGGKVLRKTLNRQFLIEAKKTFGEEKRATPAFPAAVS